MGAQNLIRAGSKWRVGSGDSVRIWGDPWLLDQQHPCVETPPPVGFENAKVSFLRDALHS